MAVVAGPLQDDEARVFAEAIVDTVREPLLVLDAGLAVVSANRAFYSHFAATPAQTEGRRVYELGDGQWDIPALHEALERVLPERRGFEDVEVEGEFEALGRRTMLLNGRLLHRGGGRPDLILLAIEDATERRRAERELREAGEYAEAIVDTVREPLLVLTPELRVRSANESFYRVFGVDPGETLGRPLYELGGGHWDIPELRRLLEDVLPDNRVFNDFIVEHDFPDLGRRSMLLNARRLDHTQLILLAIEDVTERRRAEAAEAEWHWRFAAAVRAGGLVLYDSDKRTGAIAWNGEAERVLGYAPAEMGGYAWWFERVHPDDRGRVEEAVLRALAGREPLEVEYRLRHRDGSYRAVADRGELDVGAAGEVVRVVGFVQDVTGRREAEEQRELLLAEMSHRFKNLLALVQSLAAQTGLRSRSVEEFRAVFEGRLQALARTHGLLFEARWRGADLRALVGEMLEPYRLDRAEAVAIEGGPVTLSPKHGLTLSLVLHELATNAAKYGALSAPAGRVRVAWRVVEDRDPGGGDGGRRVRLCWEERDGPRPVAPPGERGFGTRLIERACAYELGGEAELSFEPGGLRCEIAFPL